MKVPEAVVIQVPVENELPLLPPRRTDAVRTVDDLLTRLLRHEYAALCADFCDDGGAWHLLAWTPEREALDEVIAVTEPLGQFRMLLARFGAHYMGGQFYGGYSELRVSQCDEYRALTIDMANDARRGHWIRAYSRPAIRS